MTKMYVVNAEAIPSVLIAATEATELATAAAQDARAAAASINALALANQLLPLLVERLGGTPGAGTGNDLDALEWSAVVTYPKNTLVTYTLPDGRSGTFVSLNDVPAGTPPTDSGFWLLVGTLAASTYSLDFSFESTNVEVVQGAYVDVVLTIERQGGLGLDEPLEFFLTSNEPGFKGEFARVETTVDDEEGEPAEELEVESESYRLRLSASTAVQLSQYDVNVTVQSSQWREDPASPYYKVRSVHSLRTLVTSSTPVAPPNASAQYGMLSTSYVLSEFLADSSGNGLTLLKAGRVMPNSRGDGWKSEGTDGALLWTPTLTGHSMSGPNEVIVIVPSPETVPNGSVIAALQSVTNVNDYVALLKVSSGYKLRVGSGGSFVESPAVAVVGRVGFTLDPSSGKVFLHNLSGALSVEMARPAWASSNVRGSYFGTITPAGEAQNESASQALVGSFTPGIFTSAQRFQKAQQLMAAFTKRASTDSRPEYPTGVSRVLEMKKGEALKNRTFLYPDIILLGDAVARADGGIETFGAAGSGAWTGWMDEVTWENDWEIVAKLQDVFSLTSQTALSLSSQVGATRFFRVKNGTYKKTDGTTVYDIVVIFPSEVHSSGSSALHLDSPQDEIALNFRYDASTRKLDISELTTGRTLGKGSLTIPATYMGKLGLSWGMVYRGDSTGVTEPGASRPSGATVARSLHNETERSSILANLTGTYRPTEPSSGGNVPAPIPETNFELLTGKQDWKLADLPSPVAELHTSLGQAGWWFMPNDKRSDKIANHIPWEPEYKNRYVWKTHDGERYKYYTGPLSGAYFIGRQTVNMAYCAVGGILASDNLTYVDVCCADAEAMVDAARDNAGIGSDEPDGFLGFAYGCTPSPSLFFGPDHPDNTAVIRRRTVGGVTKDRITYADQSSGNDGLSKLTGIELQLEEGILQGFAVIALMAHDNRNNFSPIHEPNKTGTPAYYRRVRDKILKLYEDTCAKWNAHYAGKSDSKSKRMLQLPLNVRRTLVHPIMAEMASKVAYAKIKGGANWKTHSAYLEAKRAWNLCFGPNQKVGARYFLKSDGKEDINKCTWFEGTHAKYGKCIFWAHQMTRFSPGSTKDADGEYITDSSKTPYLHPHDYTTIDFGAMVFMHEMGCDFVTKSWMEGVANGLLVSTDFADDRFTRSSGNRKVSIPYAMNGNNLVPGCISPWSTATSSSGAVPNLLVNAAALLAAYERTGTLAARVRSHYSKHGSTQTKGVVPALMLYEAKRAGALA